jgi:hypothetical protein
MLLTDECLGVSLGRSEDIRLFAKPWTLQSLLGVWKFLLDAFDTDLVIIRPFPYQRNIL